MKYGKQMLFKACLMLLALVPAGTVTNADTGEAVQPMVQVQGRHLSIRAVQAPLEMLLSQIARQSGIEIFLQGQVEANVNMSVNRASLETGIKRLISGYNHAFTYGYDDRNYLIVKQLYVYSKTGIGPMRRMDPLDVTPPRPSTALPAGHGIVIHAQTPHERDPLVSMRAIDPLMKLNQAQAPYLPEDFHGRPGPKIDP